MSRRAIAGFVPAGLLGLLLGGANGLLGVCGPFTDVTDGAFCPFVLEIFTLGITTGTTPTTYDPTGSVTRLQMAAFLSRTVDAALKRGSRRAAMRQFWTAQATDSLEMTTLGAVPEFVEFDGADLWVTVPALGEVARVRASDGRLLETWTGVADFTGGISFAMGKVFATGHGSAGRLYRIDPALPAGGATMVASGIPQTPIGLAFDGGRFWTANVDGSVSIVTPGASIPWTVTTVSGIATTPLGILYDGSNVWITDSSPGGSLRKLNASGTVTLLVTIGGSPKYPVFDGSNIWVPNGDVVDVVRASNGTLLSTLTGNGRAGLLAAAFDGQRVLVTSQTETLGDLLLWKAADLTPLGAVALSSTGLPFGTVSDGVNFWVALQPTGPGAGWLMRF